MSDCPDAALPAAPITPSADARAARLKKFERERLIVYYLNRGLSVAEIAARAGVSEKRMRAVIREILARRMPAPPEEFVAVQVSRLNEALLVAYSAMEPTNLKAVGHVVRIVRELDRYHGLFAGRRLHEASRRTPVRALEAPVEANMAFGATLTCRPIIALQDFEMVELVHGVDSPSEVGNLVEPPREDGSDCRARSLARRETGVLPYALWTAPRPGQRPGPTAPRQARALNDRPENPAQDPEKIESAPGIAATPGASGSVDAVPEQVNAFARPEPARELGALDAPLNDRPENRPQDIENVESAPGNTWAADASAPASAGASVVSSTVPGRIETRRPNVRMTLNGVVAC